MTNDYINALEEQIRLSRNSDENGEFTPTDQANLDRLILILKYALIQLKCIKSGHYIEHYDYANLKPWKWHVNCKKEYPTTEEYIEEYGFDPYEDCFHCEKDEEGNLIDERDICDPCNPCINFEYQGDCSKIRRYYLMFDLKAGRYWQHPLTHQVMWQCEKEAIYSWESDTPPRSPGKQQMSFYDPTKKKGNNCPYHDYPPETKEEDKVKISNDFKWCVPMWNDQCRFVVVEFLEHIINPRYDYTITTSWHVMDKCNQEECDILNGEGNFYELDGTNRLPRFARYCKQRCYNIDDSIELYPAWEGDLVNYTHNGW